jgi:hypothetical protein
MVDLVLGRGITDLIHEAPFLPAYLQNTLGLNSFIQSLQYMAR